jgi:hypothetical protein
MADIKFTLLADDSQFNQTVNKAIQDMRKLATEAGASAEDINKAFQEMGKNVFSETGAKGIADMKEQLGLIEDEIGRTMEALTKLQNTDGFDENSKEAKELTGYLAELRQSAEDYKQVLEGANAAQSTDLKQSGEGVKSLTESFKGLPGPVGGAVGSFKKLISAAKAFIATPLGAVIALLGAALGALKSYFTGSADGQAKLAKSTAYLGSIMDTLKDAVIAVGRALSEAFDNPSKAIDNLAKKLKQELKARLDGLVSQFKAIGKMLKGLVTLDWDEMKEGASDYANAVSQVVTGKTIDEIKDGIAQTKEQMSAWRKKTEETANAMAALAERETRLRQQRSKWQVKEADLDNKIAQARMKAYDEDATRGEQAQALEEQQRLITEKYEQQIKFAKEEYAITKKRNSLHESTIEDLEKEDELQANITKLEAQMNSELAGVERRRASASKAAREQEFNLLQEAKQLEIQIGEERLKMQDESLNKTLEQIELDRRRRQIELDTQKHQWETAQGGELTKAQKEYIESMGKLINEAAATAGETAIFEKYADAAQKAMKQHAQSESDIKLLKDQGREREAAEAERQRNEQALAYMQDVEGGLTPEFKMWIDSLGDYTTKTLESMLASAEEQLTVLKAAGAPQEEIIAAEARIAALNKEVKEAQTDIQRGPKLTAYKNLNKVLGDAASGFESLAQTGNEAFDSLMKNVADITSSVQSVVGNIQTLVQSSIEAEKTAAQEGASAVKTVEKASVILAIIGAALALAMKIKSMFADDGSRTEEVTKQVDALRNALRDLKREMALDVSQNDTIFGDNAYKNLMQYTQATKDYAKEYEKSVNEMALAGLEAQRRGMKGQVETGWFGMQGKKEKADIDRMFDDIESQYKDRTLSLNESVELLMNNTLIQTQKRGWLGLRKEKYKALSEIAKDNGLSIIGGDDAETIQNLKALKDSVSDLDDETKTAIDNMIADWETYNQALEGVKSTYTSWFGDMASTFADSIKLGFTDGAKAGRDNFKEQVNGMLSDMFLQLTIGKNMESIMGKYTGEIAKLQMQGASPTEIANTAAKAADEFLNNYDTSLKAYEDFQNQLEQRGFGIKDSIDGTLSGAIKGASQESIDLLSGYCNAVRIQQVDGINIMREQLISLSGIEGNTRAINVGLQGFRTSMENILRTDGARAVGAN